MSTDQSRPPIHATDAINLGLSDHSVKLHFMLEMQGGENETQTSVFMTHKTMKMLQLVLTAAVEAVEARQGEIPFDPKHLAEVEKALKNVGPQSDDLTS